MRRGRSSGTASGRRNSRRTSARTRRCSEKLSGSFLGFTFRLLRCGRPLPLEPIGGFQVTGILTLDRPRVCVLVFERRDYERNIFIGNVHGHRLHDIFPGIVGSLNTVNDAEKAEAAERRRAKERAECGEGKAAPRQVQ